MVERDVLRSARTSALCPLPGDLNLKKRTKKRAGAGVVVNRKCLLKRVPNGDIGRKEDNTFHHLIHLKQR